MGQLARNLRKLATVPARAARTVAKDIAALIDDQFQHQADPYGNAWKPHAPATVERWGEHPILDLSGEMRRSVAVRPMVGAGVSVTIDHPSEDHQTGWDGPQGKGPARPILPGGTMPAQWRERIDGALDSLVKDSMRRTG
jgi:hypothetical protein